MKKLLFLTLLICAGFSHGQDYSISHLSIYPPLAPMSGSDYTVDNLAMSPPAQALAGGDFTMEMVLTPLPPIVVLGDAEVFITIASGAAVLTWTAPHPNGFILESSPSLGASADWQPVTPTPTEPRYVTALNSAPKFFRLRRP